MTVTGKQIIDEALSFVGTPCVHMGRTKGTAIDCIGLILEVLKNVGYEGLTYEDLPYGMVTNSKLRRGLEEHAEVIWDSKKTPNLPPLTWAKEGDLLSLAWRSEPMHIAFITRRPILAWYMIHSFSDPAKVVYHRIDERWESRIKGLYRLSGVV